MKNFLSYITSFFKTDSNNSVYRLAFWFVIGSITSIWVTLSLKHGILQDIPNSVVVFIGVVTSGKLVQNYQESIDSKDS